MKKTICIIFALILSFSLVSAYGGGGGGIGIPSIVSQKDGITMVHTDVSRKTEISITPRVNEGITKMVIKFKERTDKNSYIDLLDIPVESYEGKVTNMYNPYKIIKIDSNIKDKLESAVIQYTVKKADKPLYLIHVKDDGTMSILKPIISEIYGDYVVYSFTVTEFSDFVLAKRKVGIVKVTNGIVKEPVKVEPTIEETIEESVSIQEVEEPEKSNKGWIIGLVIFLVVIIAVIGYLYFVKL